MIVARIAALLANASASLQQEPVAPTHLRQLNVRLDEMHGKGMAVGEGLLAATLRKLSKEGVGGFDAGDDLIMCNGFMYKHALLDGKSPCMIASVRDPLLGRWQAQLQENALGMLLWRAACMAYFLVEEREAADPLRHFLKAGRSAMQQLDRKPAWLVFFLGHATLFDDRPGLMLANQWFSGQTTLVEQIREHAELPGSSWLWEEMVVEILRKIETLTETAFVAHVRNLLQLSRQYMRQRDRIFAVMIEKYARFGSKDVPAPLIEAVIDAWGNPQMERVDAAHRWSNVSEKTRIWMCQLLAEKDLADFFELINKGSKAGLSAMDTRRLMFWKRYTQHMSYTRLILGESFHNSRNGSISTFVANRRNRLGMLVNDPDNAAFLMRIGNHWCIEFSQTGNAFYAYSEGAEPFDPHAGAIRTSDMKERGKAAEWIAHSGAWEDKLGLYVDQLVSPRSTFSRPPVESPRTKPQPPDQPRKGGKAVKPVDTGKSPKPPHPPAKPSADTSINKALDEAAEHGTKAPAVLQDLRLSAVALKLSPTVRPELGRLFLREVDNRDKQGAFWLELNGEPSEHLLKQMQKLGFSHKPGRGFYQ